MPLEDIPHLHLVFLTGSVPGSVYIFFPNIYSIRIEADKYESNHLTDEELQLWFTAIFWPALNILFHHQYYRSSLPRGLRYVRIAVLLVLVPEIPSYIQTLSFLGPQFLHAIWAHITATVSSMPALHCFKSLFLTICVNNIKLSTYSTTSWFGLYYNWRDSWTTNFDPAYINRDQCWYDLGRTITPSVVETPTSGIENAEVYTWRACCMEQYYKKRIGPSLRAHLRMDSYPMATLNDTACYTFYPPVSSAEFKAGFRYSQFYSKSKINYQVSAHGIFDHPLLESICINEAYRRSLATKAHDKFISTKAIGTNYLHSKHLLVLERSIDLVADFLML